MCPNRIKKFSYSSLLIFVIGLLGISNNLIAQVIPPDFICVKGDTLIWQLPSNTCGTFNNYTIFFSSAQAGPYQVLATITDASQTNFVHEESVTGQFFYYLQSDFNCPGEAVLSSDTLDNRLPEIIRMTDVSVSGDDVIINWEVSTSPEVTEYIIYRITPSGTVPIATVPIDQLSYTDTDSNPRDQQEFYYVLAGDACGNTSIFQEPQGTILLAAEGESCDQTFTLDWNIYENWTNPIAQHEILLSINGEIATVVDTVAGTASTYIYEGVNDNDEYCFVVQAVESSTGYAAASNEICLTADIIQPNRDLYLRSVSVTPDNQVELNWQWTNNAEINQRTILRLAGMGDFENIDEQLEDPPLATNPTFLDETAAPNESTFVYQITTIDDCGEVAASNQVGTVLLTGISQNNQKNLLSWTIPVWNMGKIDRYELYKIIGGQTELISTVRPPVNSFEDALDPSNLAEIDARYYLLVYVTITLPNGQMETVQVRSNTLTIQQSAKISVPNAFAPTGRNQTFRPVVTFGDNLDYQLIIYNRYGGIVFETTNLTEGWDGRDSNGRLHPGGVYVYYVNITQPDGSLTQDKGTLVLLP